MPTLSPHVFLRASVGVLILTGCGEGKLGGFESAKPGSESTAPALQVGSVPGTGAALGVLSCQSTVDIVCYRDTAYVSSESYYPDIYPTADWIYFGSAGDSIEISTVPPGAVATNLGEERDSLHNTAPYFRRRLTSDGVLRISVVLDQHSSDTVAYTLRLVHNGALLSTALQTTGQTATLRVPAVLETDRFSVVPVSVRGSVRELSMWTVPAGTHKVALVSDSLYEVCTVPCSQPDTVKLTPSVSITKKF